MRCGDSEAQVEKNRCYGASCTWAAHFSVEVLADACDVYVQCEFEFVVKSLYVDFVVWLNKLNKYIYIVECR